MNLLKFNCCVLSFIIIATLPYSSSAQKDDNEIDTLKRALRIATGDEQRIKLLLELSININCKDSLQKMAYAAQALDIATKNNTFQGIINSSVVLGDVFKYCYRNKERAFENYMNSAEVAKKIHDTLNEVEAYNHIGLLYKEGTDYIKAIQFFNLALSLNPAKDVASSLFCNMGVIYSEVSDYTKAMDCFEKAYDIQNRAIKTKKNPKIQDSLMISGLHLGLGDLYRAMHNYSKAIDQYELALKMACGIEIMELRALTGKGNTFYEEGNYGIATKQYLTALSLNKQPQAQTIVLFQKLASSYLKQGSLTQSLVYAEKALSTGTEQKAEPLLTVTYIILAKIKVQLKQNNVAIDYLRKAIAKARTMHLAQEEEDAWQELNNIYEQTKNKSEAYDAFKHYITLRDSIYSKNKENEFIKLDLNAGFARKEYSDSISHAKDLAIKESENRRQKAFTYGGFTGLALVILLAFFIFRNYSQQKKANVVIQAEKENAEQQRQRAERSEAFKQQFLANMSHEIRTPMNAVMGMTSLALDTGMPEKQKMYLEGIKKSSDNLLHIINDILDLSKIEAGKMELEEIDFSLAATVDHVKQVLSYRAEEKGLQLITYIDPALPDVVTGDPVRLGQALLNLAGNGIKFTEQGSVSIKVKKVAEGVRFSVTDTGIGIPKDKLELVFEKFSQANSSDTRKYGGTGLGLSISQQLVELMGGHIHIESEEGSGTTFSFILNLPHGSAERLKQRLAAEEDVDGSALDGLSILVVDDNEYNRIVARDTLEAKAKVKIDAVGSAKEGLALLQQKHFDMVLMDVQMPVMNGFDATRHIREQMEGPVKDIAVIALTASVLRTDLDKCKAAGMNAYVSKPFKASQLIGAIAEVLGLSGGAKKPVPAIVKEVVAGGITDLTYLTNYCEGDKERIAGYINMYLKAAAGFEEKARAAIASPDPEDAAALAHAFKPKWTMMGMALCVDLGQKVEFMSKEAGNEEHIKNALLRLTEYNRQSVMELESFV